MVLWPNMEVRYRHFDVTCIFIWIHVVLTHWGRMTHTCVSYWTIIGSDNGLSPGRRQALIWNHTRILLIRNLGTNFSEILSEIHTLWFKKMHLKMSSWKWRPFCLSLNVLISYSSNLQMMIQCSWIQFKCCNIIFFGVGLPLLKHILIEDINIHIRIH